MVKMFNIATKRLFKMHFKLMRSIFARLLFVGFCAVAVWRVTIVYKSNIYWCLLLLLIPLLAEAIFVIVRKQHDHSKWWIPKIFFFLIGAAPCIWLLEINHFEDRRTSFDTSTIQRMNETTCRPKTECTTDVNERYRIVLEQVLIFILILAKWIAPKGKMTLDELSQLLLIYISSGADVVDLLGTFGSEDNCCRSIRKIYDTKIIIYFILGIWTWSLLQFIFILSATKTFPDFDDEPVEEIAAAEKSSTSIHGPNTVEGTVEKENNLPIGFDDVFEQKKNAALSIGEEKTEDEKSKERRARNRFGKKRYCNFFCFYNEIWGITMGILFQDLPFLALRLTVIFYFDVVTHDIIFFTVKNLFVIILALNRVRVVVKMNKDSWRAIVAKANYRLG